MPGLHGVQFDGTSSFGLATDSASLRLETNNAFSISCRLWLDSYNNNVLPRVWEKRSSYVAIMGDPGNGRYRMIGLEVVNAGATVVEYWGNTRLSLQRWYSLVVTFDGAVGGDAQATMYLDGVAETVTRLLGPWTGTLQDTSTFDFNVARRRTDLLRNLQGRLGFFHFYQRVLTAGEAAQIAADDDSVPGEQADWDFTENSGAVALDGSGNGNTLVLTNPTWVPDTSVPLQYSQHVLGTGVGW